MLLLMIFALLAGAGTALSPCVLPILPALLGAGVTGGRRRPAGVLVGLVAPALVFGLSSLASGDVPVSVAGWLNFVYPVSVVVSLRARSGVPLTVPARSPA